MPPRRKIVRPPESSPPPPDPTAAALARVAAAELERRQRLPRAVASVLASLDRNPWQRRFVEDPSRRVATCAGRRSGKTRALVARALVAASAHPGSVIPIVERTFTCQAAVTFWADLQDVDRAFGLGMVFNHTLYRARLSNGSEIMLATANTVDEADKLRGGKYPVVIVDEAGTFRAAILEYLIHEVIEPALMDYDGALIQAGTPAPRRVGPFHAACTDPTETWKFHHATFRENDALPLEHDDEAPAWRRAERERWFEELKRGNGWTDDSPWVRREYFGEWVEDTEGLIYRLGPANHVGMEPPDLGDGEWRFGLGIDFGYDPDPCAFVVLAWRRGEPWLWVLESFERPRLIPSAVAAVVERLRIRYRFSFIVGDMGGYGKGPAEEMRQRYGIPIEPARKRGKEAHVAFVNGDLASGTIRIVESGNEDLIADLYALRRAEGSEWAEDARDDNHLPDAFLYAVMGQHQTAIGFTRPAPERGSREWEDARERNRVDAYERRLRGAGTGDTLGEALGQLPGG